MSTAEHARGDATTSRATRQRAALLDVLGRCPDFVSAQELHHRMRDEGHTTGLTTVYRHLHKLADEGRADVVVSPDDGALYRVCASDDHHHHLVCRQCGLTVEVEGPEVEEWADRIGRNHGFADLEHQVEVFGLCRACGGPGA